VALSKRKRGTGSEEPAQEWLLTYSDLVTLLLTFFVMLFSMATIDKQKFIEIANSFKSQFINRSNGEMFNKNSGKDLIAFFPQSSAIDDSDRKDNEEQDLPTSKKNVSVEEAFEIQEKLDNTLNRLKNEIRDLGLKEEVTLIDGEESVIIRIDSALLFDLGKADIKESAKDSLQKIGLLLKDLDNEIFVQGHTDNLPINTLLFPTNWELSTKRATNVVLFLIDKCGADPVKLTATGNGEFRPIRPNDSEENRQKNRRVDIVIKKIYATQ